MVTIVNCTPHRITFLGNDGGVILELEPSGICPRCRMTRESHSHINGIPVNVTVVGELEGLPERKRNTIYIVSRIVAEAAIDRDDFYIVDDAVRDDAGRIIGCRALAKV